ncbi:MAG: ATP-binding protein [Fibrobacteria bacterium]|nr:ATP-binding protein [Fibrobacteria bacterium]
MERTIQPVLIQHLLNPLKKETIVIEGARQVGKSHLVMKSLDYIKTHENIKCFSFDLEKNARLRRSISQTEDFADFKDLMQDQYKVKNNSILFLDEAQECPGLSHYVKSFKEDWPEVKIILTGSSMNRFFPENIRIPVGRIQSLRVFPFSFSEFIRFIHGEELYYFLTSAPKKVSSSRHRFLLEQYDNYLRTGGYPEAVKALFNKESPIPILEDIIGTQREDFQRKEAYQPKLFDNILQAVANNIGSPSKYSQIDATKYHTKNAMEAMKAWHIVHEVNAHSFDPKHSAFLPKRYLHDAGIVNMMRTVAVPQISVLNTVQPVLRTPLGGLFENLLLLNLLEGQTAAKTIGSWKKSANTDIEVDFIVNNPDNTKKIPIECKAALQFKKKHYKNILYYLSATGQTHGIVASAAPFQKLVVDNKYTIVNIPVYLCTRENIIAYVS